MKTLLLAATAAAVLAGANPAPAMADATQPVSQVVQWNRTLLVIVRTPGAQPATIHPTRSFAIMHAAIYDAVNAIDGTHKAYLVGFSSSPVASQEAAAASAAHEVLVKLYPNFQATLDAQLQRALAQLPDQGKAEGIRIGNAIADRILAVRANDGSNNPPATYVFGTAPGDYQSTPPNFPPQPQFTSWSHVTPFALEAADQFRPGGPPKLTSDRYTDAFDLVKTFGIAGGTAASADEALTGRFWNGAIQNYWNEIAQTASLAHELTTAENARLFALLNLSFADGVIAFYDAKYTYKDVAPHDRVGGGDPGEVAKAAGRELDGLGFEAVFEIGRGADDRVGDQMRQVRSHRQHLIVMSGAHRDHPHAGQLPHARDCGHRFGGGLRQRDQDAPAAAEELRKSRLGSRVLGSGDWMAGQEVDPGQHMGPEVADHRLLDRSDIGQDGTLLQRRGDPPADIGVD